MPQVNLSGNRPDYESIRAQLQAELQNRDSWKGLLPTQTGQTFIDFVASIGAFANAQAVTLFRDSFSETTSKARAQYAIADTMGLRLNRKTPASATVRATYTQPIGGPATISIPEFTQFQGSGTFWFNETALTLSPGVPVEITLRQGYVVDQTMSGLGKDHVLFVSPEKNFSVSDVEAHVQVYNGNTRVQRVTSPLWLYRGSAAVLDRTTPDGRLMLQFGTTAYGYRPATTDTVRIRYAVTSGVDGNSVLTINTKPTTVQTFGAGLEWVFTSNPTGGGNEPSATTLKQISASNFGDFGAAVIRSQYLAAAVDYPGVVDARTYAQRELDTSDLRLMNVIRVIPLTSTVWTQTQKDDYLKHLQSRTMYAPRFVWVDPVAVPRNLKAIVYCYSWANATQCAQDARSACMELFQAKRGHLGRDLMLNDFHVAMKASNPGIETVDIITPVDDMLVSGVPLAKPDLAFTASGTLPAGVYSYSVYATDGYGPIAPVNYSSIQTTATGGITVTWLPYSGAVSYTVVGRSGPHGAIITVPAGTTTWTDNGSLTPATTALPTAASYPALYNSAATVTVTGEFTRRSTT